MARYATFLESEFITNETSGSNESLVKISETTDELDSNNNLLRMLFNAHKRFVDQVESNKNQKDITIFL